MLKLQLIPTKTAWRNNPGALWLLGETGGGVSGLLRRSGKLSPALGSE